MIEQLKTIRTAVNLLHPDVEQYKKAVEALTQLEAMVGEHEPVAKLHDDGYWTPMKTEAGRALNERLLRAGSPSIEVYTAAPVAQQQEPVAQVTIGTQPWNKGLSVVDLEQPLRVGTKLYAAPVAQQPQAEAVPSDVTDAMVVAGARALCNRFADTGGVSREDQWNIYVEDFKDDARAVLNAAIAQQKGQP